MMGSSENSKEDTNGCPRKFFQVEDDAPYHVATGSFLAFVHANAGIKV